MGALEGKVAVIAGASSGFGEALAKRFRKEGAKVVLAARRLSVLEGLAGPLEALAVECDITKDESVQKLAQAALTKFGRIDIAVNSAGFEEQTALRDLVPEKLEPMVAVQFTGAVYFLRHMANAMQASGGGSIINISSVTATLVPEMYAAYAGAKAGINQVVRIAAAEYGRHNVRVNTVSPSLVETPMTAHLIGVPAVKAAFLQETPLGYLADVEDVAHTITFLVSDQARYITGQTILVDGGISLRRLPTEDDVMRQLRSDSAPKSAPVQTTRTYRLPPEATDPRLSGEIQASADEVWKLMSDFGNTSWVPGVSRSELVGQGVGAYRLVYAGNAPPLKETLEAIDAKSRTLSYSIGAGNPLPVASYRATVKIVDLGGNKSRLDWSSSFIVTGPDVDAALASVEGLYSVCFDNIKARLEGTAANQAGGAAAAGLPDDVAIRDVFLSHMPEALNRVPDKLRENEGKTLLFLMSGREAGAYCVYFRGQTVQVKAGDPGNASATIAMDSDDYRAMLNKKLDGAQAFMSGRLKITGDLGLAMRMQTLM